MTNCRRFQRFQSGIGPKSEFRTTDHVVILNLPGQPQHQFKLRLAANPNHTDEFGPWHLPDRVGASTSGEPARSEPNDAYAIRYRVL
jgi:hypothetical protein